MIDLLKKIPQSIIIGAQTKKALKISILALTGAVLILFALFFSLRNIILKNILDNKIGSYLGNHEGAILTLKAAKFSGLDRIVFENIRLQDNSKNLAINLKSCAIKFGFWKMLFGQVQPKYLQIDDFRINLNQDEMPKQNFPRLAGVKTEKKINRTIAYSAQVSDLLDLFFKRIPDSLKINRLTVNSHINNIRQIFHIPQLAINDLNFETMVQIENQEKKWACHLAGNIDRRKKQLTCKMFPLRPAEKVALPFIDQQWGVRVSLDFVEINLKSNGLHDGIL